jgi:hypothetical protein
VRAVEHLVAADHQPVKSLDQSGTVLPVAREREMLAQDSVTPRDNIFV